MRLHRNALAFLLAGLLSTVPSSRCLAQYAAHGCTWGTSNTNVWRNTGTISANGFSEYGFLLELQASISIWNEESQTPGEFQYAGDTLIEDPIPGAVLVEHQNVWACSDNTSGKAFYGGTGSCAAADMGVVR